MGKGRQALLSLLVGVASSACVPRLPAVGDTDVREVTVRIIRPPVVNLYDRGTETLGVLDFAGPSGAEIARRLAVQIEKTGAFRVLDPVAAGDRLMKAGLSVGWETPASGLRWVHERTAIDAVVIGRVEVFHVEARSSEKETLSLQGTGEYGFERTDQGKIAYREKMTYKRVPLFCRSDQGAVAASYRVWDLRRGEEIATRRHELSTEMSSFCFRGDVPERLKNEALNRLLEKLFLRLNDGFLDEIVPRSDRAQIAFEVVSGVGDASLVHRNELAILYASRGEWSRAVEMWQDCLLHRPDLTTARYNLAMAFRATGRLSQAADQLNKAIAIDPRPLYRDALAELRQATGGGALQ